MGTSCHKAIMVMAKCACYMMVMQIYYAHPDFLGFEHPVCSLRPHSSSLLSYLPIYLFLCFRKILNLRAYYSNIIYSQFILWLLIVNLLKCSIFIFFFFKFHSKGIRVSSDKPVRSVSHISQKGHLKFHQPKFKPVFK